MNRLSRRGNMGGLESATGCCMGRMDQLSNACEVMENCAHKHSE
jgi:hypothetical protein